MSKLVTIFGGSGFVGRHIARRMAKAGWRVRVAVRNPNLAMHVKPYGAVGQVEPVFCNIRDDGSVRDVLAGADAVVNCVGILVESGRNGFEAVQAEGPGRIARLAAEAGISRMVQLSAIGADAGSPSAYARSKAAGEAAVLAALPGAMVLRPSVIFGPGDSFFNRFAAMAQFGPVLPITGAGTRFQPVYVDDVAAAAELYLLDGAGGGIYELGGPEVKTFRALMQDMLGVIRKRRWVLALPQPAAQTMAWSFDMLQKLSGGLLVNRMLTRDQLKSLARDNVVAPDARGFADLGISPAAMGAVLPGYLWRFRPDGQYAVLKDAARNLRT
ncbi:complex I NDUFA9 subunit family protein [Mangrovicoccus algicola]|uniref:Complex I NDUFA9 subunit family protein n=1 Tax=Mangrovicoccus algicola TaxID=2771008 RepID=A0A8J6YYH5_9RHOB|nr:complex I NDUFA9 subunit family protein [Mangrovicoccus algicola]MBE3638944.1 complex I NDUFA9 subunit family protein [Mangrovicoccus algicola]